jgi:5-bromo-4-chloroindolyl phosphate hydrolysis protein
MPSNREFNSASRYRPDKQKDKIVRDTPILTGFLILVISVSYLSTAIKSLGHGESFYFIASLGIFFAFIASFVMLRRGIALEKIYNSSKYAKAPQFPLKVIAGALLALTSAFSALLGDYSIIESIMLGVAVLLGWYLYYGFDPRVDKIEGYENSKSAERIMKLLLEARQDIDTIKKNALELGESEISAAMNATAFAFEKMVKHIEDEPDDYDRARKYLVSYLGELKSMSDTFVKLEKRGKSQQMRDSFLDMLESAVEKLDNQYEKLLDEDMVSLDVKLSVMKQRLENEE